MDTYWLEGIHGASNAINRPKSGLGETNEPDTIEEHDRNEGNTEHIT